MFTDRIGLRKPSYLTDADPIDTATDYETDVFYELYDSPAGLIVGVSSVLTTWFYTTQQEWSELTTSLMETI